MNLTVLILYDYYNKFPKLGDLNNTNLLSCNSVGQKSNNSVGQNFVGILLGYNQYQQECKPLSEGSQEKICFFAFSSF
jgi:hypothetical protein